MIGAVQNRPGQIVESGVEQIKGVAAHLLDGTDLRDQKTALGDQVAAGLDLQDQLVAKRVFQPFARRVPQLEIARPSRHRFRPRDKESAIRRRR